MGLYGGVGVLSALALAILGADDVSRYLGQRAHQFITSEDGAEEKDADYEEAERLWANGDHLGAVHVLRDYLKRHPRRVHAHFRIAEIYENDLNNPLAAALEHEEILKFKLEPERWGWAAIHLCNLYYHLNQEEKAEALLNRIVSEFGHTQAARKARKRLGLSEDGEVEEETTEEEPAVTEGGVQLPRGFRPKK
jgi:thioredoxin-like negative regulator of GroEL